MRFELDSINNGLKSHFDDDNFWSKLGDFLLSLRDLLLYSVPCLQVYQYV